MARQKGILKYSGNLGGISHYKMKGLPGDFARVANGPSKEQIEKDPAFQRTRENNKEFGGSAKAAKSLRVGLSSVIKNFSDPQVAGRLTKIFKAVNLEGSGNRGERPIDLYGNWPLLDDFEFHKGISFTSVFNAPFSITETVARDESTLDIPAFNPMDLIDFPAGATHFRILNGIAVVSNFQYDSNSKEYEVVEPTLDQLSDVAYSAYLPLNAAIASTTSIVATLPSSPTLNTNVSVVNVVGIEFYQQVGANYYLFASGNAMKVGKIF